MLLHERFNNKEAVDLFNEALQQDPNKRAGLSGAGVGECGRIRQQGGGVCCEGVELDPKLVEAHELMANLALEDDDTKKAVAEADKALAIFERCAGCDGGPCGGRGACGPFSGCVVCEDTCGESGVWRGVRVGGASPGAALPV